MNRISLLSLLVVSAGFAGNPAALSLKVSNEVAPAGAVVQMKVSVTEPKPIFTGSSDFSSSGFDGFFGLSLNNPAGDASGAALMRAGGFQLAVASPSANLGTSLDYPFFTFAARVNPTAANGSRYPVNMDASAFQNLFGFAYPVEVKAGSVQVGKSVVISDVSPGSSVLNAGDVVTIRGQGFTPDTKIRLKEANATAAFVSPTEMRVTLSAPTDMHGIAVKATNKDGTSSVYYSYQRTARAPASQHPVLSHTEPIFARGAWVRAVFPASTQGFTGFAFQNLGAVDASVKAELKNAFGVTVAEGTPTVAPNTRVARSAQEIIGGTAAGAYWEIRSTAPVQMLEIVGTEAPEVARPVNPVAAQ
ncbi:MAG: IPT/TIG domain-containing protein [Bryobacteraceae bacterium]